MARAPKPFTPSDCDLRGLPFMPLLGDRLMESDLFFLTTGDEFKAAVALWWASWKQIPAASLPDEDRVLAGLAKVSDGRVWTKVRARALHGWVKCRDGRLYHRVVADLALEAWEERQEHRANKESETERKRREREERKQIFSALKAMGIHLAWNTPLADLRRIAEEKGAKPVGNLSGGQVVDGPAPVPAIEGTGTVEGTLREEPPIPPAGGPSEAFEKAWSVWHADRPGNRGKAPAWAEWPTAAADAGGEDRLVATVIEHMARLAKSPRETAKAFHRWLRDRGWEAYVGAARQAAPAWSGPPEIRAAVVASRPGDEGEGFAKSWLDPCGWDPEQRVIEASDLAYARLDQECAGVIRAANAQLRRRAA